MGVGEHGRPEGWRQVIWCALRPASAAWARLWPGLLLGSVCAGILLAYVASAVSGRERQLESARDATANVARALADHAEATLRIAELTVSGLVDRLEQDGTSRAALAALHTDLGQSIASSGRLQDAVVLDSAGNFLVSAKSSYSDASGAKEALAWHREHTTAALHVGPLSKDWVAAGWSILVSRRLNETDGSFGGVVIVAIDIDYFGTFYHALRLGRQGAIALTSTDGQLLMRTRMGGSVLGQDVSRSSFYRVFAENGPVGTLTVASPLDGITRQGSYRAVAGYPMVVFVGMSLDDVLAGWWRDTAGNGVVVGLLVLCTALLGVRLSRLVRSHRKAATAAQASERLYRLLAVNGTDVIVQLDTDLRRRYVSPASLNVLGYSPEAMMGRTPSSDLHPDDWPAVATVMAELRAEGGTRSVAFRFRRSDGFYLWVEASIGRMDGADGFIVSIRDISARVAVQDKLHEANSRLQRLVMLDGLTGIANRRCLDKLLEQEFRRASREEIPLSVLMIDADRFKAFNDTYGHQAGDECLRAIAGAVQRNMRRAADLAARFGGEEFVVMLPHTGQPGAMALAEMIRADIESLNIPHSGAPQGVMTVSIGVATALPGRDAAQASVLLSAADVALYNAKRAGRNRVVPAGPLDVMAVPVRLEPIMELDF